MQRRVKARPTPTKSAPASSLGNRNSAIGGRAPCGPHCERYANCRPDSPGWISKKQAASNLRATPSALRQRALRVGYASPARHAMPRRDQPGLCLNADYFALLARARKR